MKKIISALILITNFAQGQKADSTKVFQKINVGFTFATIAGTSFSNEKVPFDLGYNLLPNVIMFTPKSYHAVFYGFGDNSVRLLNGVFLSKDFDTYVLYSKKLHNKSNYLGVGVERMLAVNDHAKFFLLSEVGTDLKGGKFLSFGLLMSFQNVLWKR